MKLIINNYNSVSPLIAVILLVVVAVAIIAIILSWGKGFFTDSLEVTNLNGSFLENDASNFIFNGNLRNESLIFNYKPPKNTTPGKILITGYSLFGSSEIIPLEENIILNSGTVEVSGIDLSKINSPDRFIDLALYTSNNEVINLKKVENSNRNIDSSIYLCSSGYVFVPGSELYDTLYDKNGFCVAKYEMKMDLDSDGLGENIVDYPQCSTGGGRNSFSYSDCNSGEVVSSAEGIPISTLTQAQAVSLCQGIGGHLITNDEWMTIARNIEKVPSNWTGGAVGSGSLFKGVHLEVDTSTGVKDALTDLSGISKRSFTLSNGQVVWDLSGNIEEFTSDTIMVKNQPELYLDGYGYLPGGSSFHTGSIGYSPTYHHLSHNNLGNTTLEIKDLFLSNLDYNSDQGIGYIATHSNINSVNEELKPLIRSYGYTHHAGILGLRLHHPLDISVSWVGFRCVIVP